MRPLFYLNTNIFFSKVGSINSDIYIYKEKVIYKRPMGLLSPLNNYHKRKYN